MTESYVAGDTLSSSQAERVAKTLDRSYINSIRMSRHSDHTVDRENEKEDTEDIRRRNRMHAMNAINKSRRGNSKYNANGNTTDASSMSDHELDKKSTIPVGASSKEKI